MANDATDGTGGVDLGRRAFRVAMRRLRALREELRQAEEHERRLYLVIRDWRERHYSLMLENKALQLRLLLCKISHGDPAPATFRRMQLWSAPPVDSGWAATEAVTAR